MAMMINQRAQIFQRLGSIATSAANSAADGIAEAAKTDSKTADTALKLFGGFDRSEFENIKGQSVPEDGMPNLLVPAVRPPASYEGPAEYFKPLSNTVEGQSLLVPAKDLFQQLEDPGFRMADGLSGFSDNKITQTLAQKGMILNSKPGGGVSLGGLNENGIIIVDNKPADPADTVASLGFFGKLYRMENTVEKQLQLHDQLDFGALRFSAPKQPPLPNADSPNADPGLKGLPDVRAAAPDSKKMLDLPLDHALNGTPENVGQLLQMIDVLQVKVQEILAKSHHLSPWSSPIGEKAIRILQRLKNLEIYYQDVNPNLPPSDQVFDGIRLAIKQLLPFG